MTGEGFLALLLLIVVIVLVIGGMRLYWKMRSDNGYNMGRNYMRDMGFSDEDIVKNKRDDDRELYVFRKSREKDDRKE